MLTGIIGLDEARIASILGTIEEGVQLWDGAGKLVYANPATRDQFGADAVIPARTHFSQWASRCMTESGLHTRPEDFPVARVLAGDNALVQALLHLDRGHEQRIWLRCNAHPLIDATSGQATGAITSTVDVTELMEQERLLHFQAHYDALTGLPNRVLLADRMKLTLAHCERSGEKVAVCMLDLDGFKLVNDTYGHKVGDQLLQEVARRLQDVLRGEDTAARLGGDEFALLVGGLKTAGLYEQLFKRILDTVAAPCQIGGLVLRVSASIGVAFYPGSANDPDQLLRCADQAMYKAKQAGKNRFSIFDPNLESRARANQGLLRKMELALARGEFRLYYQPMIDCRRGRVVGLEALIRWQHPILGLRAPGEFLPLIEHEDFIITIGEWVIETALQQLEALRAAGFDIYISVNVAPRQFLRGQFDQRLSEMLATHPADLARSLEIEILETAALEDINRVGNLIRQCQTADIRFALDDFGTGFSSLVHLKRLPANVLKIDQTFVRDMLDDPGDLAIVQGVIGLAMAFQRQVVAEGVEDIEHILMLLELGCDVMQGFGLARPLPPERLIDWLRAFQPDPRWQAASSGYPRHSDFELLLIEVAHRHWFEGLFDGLRHFTDQVDGNRTLLVFDQCRLTRWCENPAVRRAFAASQSFRELEDAHRKLHEIADAWWDGRRNAESRQAFEQPLLLANTTLVERLRGFRRTMGQLPRSR